MARKIKDKELDTREARGRLKTRGKPYYRGVERGLHLGYRRLKGRAGTWWARHYTGNQTYDIESIGIADDLSDADGVAVLDYWQAVNKARARMVSRAHVAAGKRGPLTVAEIMEDYLAFLAENRKTGEDARYRAEAFILPVLGKIEVGALTAGVIRRWHADLAKAPARVRTGAGQAQRHRGIDGSDDGVRRRRASANRMLVILKAALNMAWKDNRIASNAEWGRAKPFKGVDAARIRYLTVSEADRLINACDEDFRDLVVAALQTGARYGELTRLTVTDFSQDAGTVAIRQSKSGLPRHIVLTTEGVEFFAGLCAGRPGNETMLRKASGAPWGTSQQPRPMARACERARIVPPISFHVLRHTYASLTVMAGAPLMVAARNMGHSDTRMVEKHYGHLAASYVADTIRATAPKFAATPRRNVTPLR
jgi:integrase